MKAKLLATSWRLLGRNAVGRALLLVILTGQLHAQQSPWGTIAKKLEAEITGPIARSFALIAIVIGGITIAISNNTDYTRIIGNLILGLGLALGAVNIVSWLFT